MENYKIQSIKAREILDSRGNPTVEAEVLTNFGIFRGSAPSGASRGRYEAVELRDGQRRYNGLGVLKAVNNIREKISPALKAENVSSQARIDQILIELDGTRKKARLGGNAILAVSIAVCRAGAKSSHTPLYEYIAQLLNFGRDRQGFNIPLPCFNVINGGIHSLGSKLAVQEFMVIPQKSSFAENLEIGRNVYYKLRHILLERFGGGAVNLGDEGGFAAPVEKTIQALDLLKDASKGWGSEVKFGLDCAAVQFFVKKKYKLDGRVFGENQLLKFYQELVKKYPIIFFEDPFGQDEWQDFQLIAKEMKGLADIFGDDLTATNSRIIEKAKDKAAITGLVVKPNQAGTVSETLAAVKLAKSFGWKILAAHRSGDTCDSFIADFAVGVGADFIKAGAPARGERVSKYNRLLRIGEELSERKTA